MLLRNKLCTAFPFIMQTHFSILHSPIGNCHTLLQPSPQEKYRHLPLLQVTFHTYQYPLIFKSTNATLFEENYIAAILLPVPYYPEKHPATLLQHSALLSQGTVFSWRIGHSGEDGGYVNFSQKVLVVLLNLRQSVGEASLI